LNYRGIGFFEKSGKSAEVQSWHYRKVNHKWFSGRCGP